MKRRLTQFLFCLLMTAPAMAADKMAIVADSLWVILATVLVFFMQAGFALLESGIHSEKNITNVFMKNVMDFVIASVGFFALGFAFMFGNGNSIIGMEGWFF